MNRPAILPLPASLRALRGPLSSLGGLSGPAASPSAAPSGPASSMFDSAGASGLTVELPDSEQGGAALHAHLDSSPEVSSMLVLDPSGLWAPGLMQALAEATGSPVDRLRVHSRSGLQIRAVVDETLLPAGTGPHRLVRCLYGNTRPAERSDVLDALLAHTQVVAVLMGPMPAVQSQMLVADLADAAERHAASGLRWLFMLAADQRGVETRIATEWRHPPTVLHARPLGRSVTAVWNSLYAAWIGS